MTDAQGWVAAALGGDREAITQMVEAHKNAVFNPCYRLLGEAGEAEDVAQETFMRMYTRLRTYDSSRPFKTWLLSIASHYCIDQLRKRRLQWLSLEDESTGSHPALRMPKTPEDVTLLHERESQVQAWLNRLDPASR